MDAHARASCQNVNIIAKPVFRSAPLTCFQPLCLVHNASEPAWLLQFNATFYTLTLFSRTAIEFNCVKSCAIVCFLVREHNACAVICCDAVCLVVLAPKSYWARFHFLPQASRLQTPPAAVKTTHLHAKHLLRAAALMLSARACRGCRRCLVWHRLMHGTG